MNRSAGDNVKEMGIKKLFALSGKHVMHGCLQVFEDEVWGYFMREEIPVGAVRGHIRERFAIPESVKDDVLDGIIMDVYKKAMAQ